MRKTEYPTINEISSNVIPRYTELSVEQINTFVSTIGVYIYEELWKKKKQPP